MGYFETFVLGIAQRLTEFLPISSSACIRIFDNLFGWGNPGATFAAVIRLGTKAAVIMYSTRDIGRVTSHWFRFLPLAGKGHLPSSDLDVHMRWVAIFSTISIDVLGLLFQDATETKFRNLCVVAAVLAFFAAILG